jgi:hypothetical protein
MERAKLWAARVEGGPGFAACAGTLPELLTELARAVPELAEQHGKIEWLDWWPPVVPSSMCGDYA